jgi:hypothetical protein
MENVLELSQSAKLMVAKDFYVIIKNPGYHLGEGLTLKNMILITHLLIFRSSIRAALTLKEIFELATESVSFWRKIKYTSLEVL